MSDIIDNNNINIDIKDEICMICTYKCDNLQICKNDKCSVYICNDCIKKINTDKCPYCRISNSFEIDNTIIENNNNNDNFSIYNIFFFGRLIDYLYQKIIKCLFLIFKYIIILLYVISVFYINIFICYYFTNNYCDICFLISLLFSIIIFILTIFFDNKIIKKRLYIILNIDIFLINFFYSILSNNKCIINIIYFLFISLCITLTSLNFNNYNL